MINEQWLDSVNGISITLFLLKQFSTIYTIMSNNISRL